MRFKSREQQAAVMMQYSGPRQRNRRFAVRKNTSTVRTGKVTTSKVNKPKTSYIKYNFANYESQKAAMQKMKENGTYDPGKDPSSGYNKGRSTKEERQWMMYQMTKSLGKDPGLSPWEKKHGKMLVKESSLSAILKTPLSSGPEQKDRKFYGTDAWHYSLDAGLIPANIQKDDALKPIQMNAPHLKDIYSRKDFPSDVEYDRFKSDCLDYMISHGGNAHGPSQHKKDFIKGIEQNKSDIAAAYNKALKENPKFVPYYISSIIKPDGKEIFYNYPMNNSTDSMHNAHKLLPHITLKGRKESDLTYDEVKKSFEHYKYRVYKVTNTSFYELRGAALKDPERYKSLIRNNSWEIQEFFPRDYDAAHIIVTRERKKLKFGANAKDRIFGNTLSE